MPFDFPDSPAVGDEYVSGGATYTFTAQGVWDLGSAAVQTDYVLKAGDVMTGHLEMLAPGKVIAKGDPPVGTGMVALTGGAAGRTGMIEFYNDTAQRLARFGWGTAAQIEFVFENGCRGMKMQGGLDLGSSAVTDPTDVSRHLMLYAGASPQDSFGIGVTGGRINYSVGDDDRKHVFLVGPDEVVEIDKTGVSLLKGEIYATPADTNGITFSGGGRIYKESGTGMVLRKSSGGQQWTVENVDKSGRVYIATTSFATTVEDQIRDAVAPLLASIAELKAEVATLKAGPKAPPKAPPPPPKPTFTSPSRTPRRGEF